MCGNLSVSSSKTFTSLITRNLTPIKSSLAISSEKIALYAQISTPQLCAIRSKCCCGNKKEVKNFRYFSDRKSPENIYQIYWDEKNESMRNNTEQTMQYTSNRRLDDIHRKDDYDRSERVYKRTWTEFREPAAAGKDLRSIKGGLASVMALRPKKVRYFTLFPNEPTEFDLE